MVTYKFKYETLENLLECVIDYRGRTPNKTGSGIPLITAKIIKGGRLLPYNEYISSEDYPHWMTRGFPQIGDVLITTEAPLGEVAQIRDENVALAQRIVLLRGKKNILNNSFLKFVLQTDYVKHQLSKRSSGSTVTGIKQSELRKILVPLTDYVSQCEIAHILGTLDDKIELNRKISKTLEEMAQTLYKHWFIDFEFPNEDGKPYKTSGGEMIDSELGLIPKGWRVGSVSDLATIVGGGTPSTKEPKYWGGDIPFVTPKDLSSISSYYLHNTDRSVTKVGSECISSGVLPEDTILLSSRAPIGYTAILTKPSIINQGFIACKCVQPYYMGYLFLWIWNNIENIKLYANGSTFMEINKDNFKRISVLLPPNRLLMQFNNDLLPLLSSIKHLFDTNSLLGETHVRLKSSFFQIGE